MAEPLKLVFKPGINRESTDYGNTGGYYDANLVRFCTGLPESEGGWAKFTIAPVSGTFRSLFPFSLLSGDRFYASGTNLKYYLIRGGDPIDITPIRRTVTLANNPFTTSASSQTVTVTDVANGSVVSDFVTFSGAAGPIGGVPAADLNIEHQITGIVDADHYTIAAATTASSGASGGGAAVVATYQINVGLDTTALGNGWGIGPWGRDGWGEGADVVAATNRLRLWTEDNFGEDLLFNVRDGGIYYKDMSAPVSDRGVNLTTLGVNTFIPSVARQVMVSDIDRHVIALACNSLTSGVQDRLLVRWSDIENVANWTVSTTTSAGGMRVNGGSEIIKGIETQTEILIFTDVSLHSMKYVGPPYFFGQTRVGTNIQLIGPNAVTTTGSETYWMANGKFQMYDGRVRDIPCDVLTYIFDILNAEQSEKIYAGVNRKFSEVLWLLPVNGSQENNFYVKLNYEDPTSPQWTYGAYNAAGRTTWIDAWFETTPLAGAPDGYLYQHDFGTTDGSVDPVVAIETFLDSSVFEVGTGGDFMFISRLIPDVSFDGSSAEQPEVTITFTPKDYPGSPYATGYAVQVFGRPDNFPKKNDIRIRGQSFQYRIESNVLGTKWRQGVPRVFASPDGRR